MLDRLECYNFKSYRGRQTIGPFHSFTAVIGPNGAGKSNLMDAISFVLGVRSASLRSTALKDLIYRSGRKRRDKKGKGKAIEGEDDDEDEGEEEGSEHDASGAEVDGDEDDGVDGERTAWVMAVYVDREEKKEWRFQRSISTSGTSEYKINGKTVLYKRYNEQLESFNILVKAKNFLVFQGDVEAVASQSPKDLSRLIDQISGSLDLKDEYDQCFKALTKATEASMAQHSRRKGVNSEVKQYQLMKSEAERWQALQGQRADAVVHHLVWKLFHIEEGIKGAEERIDVRNDELKKLREENEGFEEEIRARKKEVTKATKEVTKQEREVKKKEKDLEDARPALAGIDTKRTHALKSLKHAEDQSAAQKVDHDALQQKLDQLNKDRETAERAAQKHREAQAEAAQEQGISLSAEDLAEYNRLKSQASTKAVAEREALATLVNDDKTKRDALSAAQDQLDGARRKIERLEGEEATLEKRKEVVEAKQGEINGDLKKTRTELDELRKRKAQIKQTEAEYNEKLERTLQELQQAGAARQEKESETRFKETLATLKKTFPGVKGRIIDLCKPTIQKYGTAVTTVLGRNIDSIVVDTERTAISCIEYMRVQRLGQATFVPLETVSVKPVNDKYRSFAKGARLAIDVINFDPAVEKAMQFACGNALVCDSMQIARHVCYDRGQEVKAVTLEGTVIHRSGTITGGTSHGGTRHFEDQEVEALQRRRSELQGKLAEVHKSKPYPHAEKQLIQNETRLKADLQGVDDDLSSTNSRLKGVKDELKALRKRAADLAKTVSQLERELDQLEEEAATHREVIEREEDAIFAAFCARIGVADIREYEEKQLRSAQEDNAQMLKFDTQLLRLNHQIRFQAEQVDATQERLDQLKKTAQRHRGLLEQLDGERDAKQAEIEHLEQEVADLRLALDQLTETLEEKKAEHERVRKDGGKAGRALDKALKEIASCNDEIERLSSERFTLYRRCKLEEIDLPLNKGKLDDIPIEEAAAPAAPMDVDGPESGTQNVYQANDYGVEVDFDELDEDEEEDSSDAMEEKLLAAVNRLQGEIDKMSVNLKAIERLGDSEARFKEIDGEFDEAREATRKAKDAFNAVKKKRCDLFNKAFKHIEDNIDQVYKDLTKGAASPQGGVAYLSLEEPDEPYLHGIKYHAMPPLKRFRDMDQLSGGEKTMAALALLFAIHSFQPSPFFVLDEVDGALDNTNVGRVARYVQSRTEQGDFQCIVITHKQLMFESSSAIVGIFRDAGSKTLTLDLTKYAEGGP
ncbi:Structural maintenance of chromosomes protein 1 [Rhodotorula kratochvilovae]